MEIWQHPRAHTAFLLITAVLCEKDGHKCFILNIQNGIRRIRYAEVRLLFHSHVGLREHRLERTRGPA